MASITKLRHLFKLSFKNPLTNNWDQLYYKDITQAKSALATHQYIENCKKIGSDDWKKVYTQTKKEKTIAEVFDSYQKNFLVNKTNHGTIKRRNVAIRSLYRVYEEGTVVSNIRKKKVHGVKGWQLYKDFYQHLSRRTVNGYLTEIGHMFRWAKETQVIECAVISKHDLYTKDELQPILHKEWKPNEVIALKKHLNLTEYQRDFLNLYILTGLRVSELLGHNYDDPDKEFNWDNIDFDRNILYVQVKRSKIRLARAVHQDVMNILVKWKGLGFKKPLDFNYGWIRNNILPSICMTLGFIFTMHDLRRLNAQLARPMLGLEGAAKSIGDSSLDVVEKHYAHISFAEMNRINDAVKEQLTTLTETHA